MTFFLVTLSAAVAAYLAWGFTVLPREGWQFLAALPVEKREEGGWRGVNLTWYGVFTANAYVAAVLMCYVLMRSAGVSPLAISALALLVLACCVPASRLVARVVERKSGTFTVGGAVFVGIIMAPLAVSLLNAAAGRLGHPPIPLLPALAALAIAYALGEGLGRLACVSFGCCYGKPLADTGPLVRRLFSRFAFVFHGETRKIAYAHGLHGCPVVPIQAVTAILYCLLALVSSWLFLAGRPATAYLLSVLGTQAWRSLSEYLRADFRGSRHFTVYQALAILGALYAVSIAAFVPRDLGAIGGPVPGLADLWSPVAILLLQGLWLVIFLYTGRSTVTGSEIRFHVHPDRV